MEKFQLQLFQEIIGIGSASGILYHNNLLFIISDNSSFLYELNLDNDHFEKHALDNNPQENIPKKDKPDFEAINLKDNTIIILSSGSTEKRNKGKIFDLKFKKSKTVDYTKLFDRFKKLTSLSKEELNIEGLINTSEKTYFFQRGNSIHAANGIFILDEITNSLTFKAITLPALNGIESSFTDAILVTENIYFLAAVENTISTYDDGEILGTFLCKMRLDDFVITKTLFLSEKHKFEGITLYQQNETLLTFLLCEDNDDEQLKSKIYKLTINK
ncbi:hypothetical protein FIA58_005165 [Flavobacterium jejuense]|uniref:Phytase-like domain-containing protein n=1 Tax=Flavobacterium jejuense TaxID=1544455 RepID=A0ABX0IRE8_9FLAO|nr:hypothetical protein [Flavobacterium jejuense]NHN25063.1 hypothetical protein [Flavobacterium jejuense]